MKSIYFLAASLPLSGLAITSAIAGDVQDSEILAAKFGARESVRDISLSPDGDKVAVVIPTPGGGESAVVLDLALGGKMVTVLSANGGSEQLTHCQFVIETRLVCGIYLTQGSESDIDAATRLASVAGDGSDLKLLSAKAATNAYYKSAYGGGIIDYAAAGNKGAVLMERYFPPENQTGTMIGSNSAGLGVEQVDVTTLKRKVVERPRESATGYLGDGQGNIRIMVTQPTNSDGYAKREVNYSYRLKNADGWKPLSTVSYDAGLSRGFQPVAVDSGSDVAFGFDQNGDRSALYQRSLDGSGATKLLLARPDADVDNLIQIGRSRRVVGASYATDRRLVEYFDPEIKQLVTSLAQALSNSPQISIVDASDDENRLVIFAGSDSNPGKYYLFDKTTKKLGEMFPARPELDGVAMAQMTPINFPAADGTMIPGYLTLPKDSIGRKVPAIVMPHGGPQARDELGFDWLVQFFAARGYAVLQPNYRGSSGMGTAWFQKNGWQSWKTAIGDVNDAGHWLVSQGITAPDKLAIFGWSYGGYAALQSSVLDPDLFKAIVAVAPVTDLDMFRNEFRNQGNYYIMDNFLGNGPHIEAGSPARHAEMFKAPVLIFSGDSDRNVGVAESRLMKNRLQLAGKSVQYIEFPRLAHNLDDGDARKKMLFTSDQFLRNALGIKN